MTAKFQSVKRAFRLGALAILAASLALTNSIQAAAQNSDDIVVEIPENQGFEGVTFSWGMNREASAGSYFGGCNFLLPGKAGDAGKSTVWSQELFDEFNQPSTNVAVVKPDAAGQWQPISYENHCLDRNGNPVKAASLEAYSEATVQFSGGQVIRNDDEGVEVAWKGSYTVVFYGGMTYWSASDPKLSLDAYGNGKVTATASGYGASMADASKWVKLAEREITLANLTGVDIKQARADGGFTHLPDYLGVAYSGSGQSQEVIGGAGSGSATGQAPKTAQNQAFWGAFPSDFVDYQNETGQFSYWFTSNGARDAAKPTLPLTVSFTLDYQTNPGTYSAANTAISGSRAITPTRQNPAGSSIGRASVAPPTRQSPSAAGNAQNQGNQQILVAEEQERAPIKFSLLMKIVGGLGLIVLAALLTRVGYWIRRRLGLDPNMFG